MLLASNFYSLTLVRIYPYQQVQVGTGFSYSGKKDKYLSVNEVHQQLGW